MSLKREALSSRERVRLALDHQETDRIPIAMASSRFDPPTRRALDDYLRRERGTDVRTYLDSFVDIRQVSPAYIGPPLGWGEDIWGPQRKAERLGDRRHAPAGHYDEIHYHALEQVESLGDLKWYRWPSTAWFDYSVLPERIATVQSDGEHCLMVSNGNLFETSWYLRGFRRLLEDMVLRPGLVHGIMERVTSFWIDHFRAMLTAAQGEVDLAFTGDDIAGQTLRLLSPSMWETFLKPYHVRLNEAIHEYGIKVVYTADGAAMQAVDGLIDMGIDVLQALHFRAKGTNLASLKREFGDRLCFQGGVSAQTTLLFGTPKDLRREVRELITVLGKQGGYILGPSQAVPAGTPPENIVAMFDTALRHYPYAA